MGFASSIRMNARRMMLDVNSKAYQIARELFTKIVHFTPSPSNPGPYAAGHLANQWYPDVGGNFSEELSSELSAEGAGSIARIAALRGVEFYQKDGKLTLTNNLHYAYRAEALGWPREDGWSGTIGPYRMVARSIQSILAKYK